MQWDATEGAGFTTGEPWLPVSEDGAEVNVEAQSGDPRSVLTLYRKLLALRRDEDALSVGSYRTLSSDDDVLVYEREHGGRKFVIALNIGTGEKKLDVEGEVVLSTHLDGEDAWGAVLRPNDGVIVFVA